MSIIIRSLAKRVLTPLEFKEMLKISSDKEDVFEKVANFDSKLGGYGIHNINCGNTGRYDVRDRAIYRPFQYIHAYLKNDPERIEWITREIVHMCGLHLESLMNRLLGFKKRTLGNALNSKDAQLKIDKKTLGDLKCMNGPYNDSKHHLNQGKDTHLFDLEDALLYYATTRKLSLRILPFTKLYTSSKI